MALGTTHPSTQIGAFGAPGARFLMTVVITSPTYTRPQAFKRPRATLPVPLPSPAPLLSRHGSYRGWSQPPSGALNRAGGMADPLERRNILESAAWPWLFYDPQRETRTSFELAAKALGADIRPWSATHTLDSRSSQVRRCAARAPIEGPTGWTPCAAGAARGLTSRCLPPPTAFPGISAMTWRCTLYPSPSARRV